MKKPIVIGVTGHRDLRPQDIPVLRALVREELQKLQSACPHCEFILFSALAEGADMLCAREALDLGMTLVCPLPIAEAEYEKDFEGEALAMHKQLLSLARESFVVPDFEERQPGRDFGYRQASIYVAARSHVLLALWNGKSGSPNGCGTAEAVSFALNGDFRAEGEQGAVLRIATPRRRFAEDFPIRASLLENEIGALAKRLSEIERENDAAEE